jgi:hypothetical protein
MPLINDLLLTVVLKIIRDMSLNLSYNFFCKPKPQLNDHCSLMTDCCGCGRLRFFLFNKVSLCYKNFLLINILLMMFCCYDIVHLCSLR